MTTATPTATSDEAHIRAMMESWSRALEAKDLNALTADYDPDIVLFDVMPPYKTVGIQTYRALWERSLPCFPDKFRSRHVDLHVHVSGDLAIAHCLHKMDPEDPNHPIGRSYLRATIALRRSNGAWKVFHEHVSIPFDPETGSVVAITQP